MKYPFLVLVFSFLALSTIHAQRFGYPTVQERQLIGTKWRYAYTLYLESNTTVHQADKDYQYFLFFRYDFTFEQFLHGKYTKGDWRLSNGTLFYPFRKIEKFDIAAINNKTLVLEFQQPNSSGTYQYHFVQVETATAPFIRPADELPEVVVETDPKEPRRRSWWSILRGSGDDAKKAELSKKQQIYISVELVGGGYYGGIDPVVKDFIRISTDGRLIHEYQTVNQPLRVVKKNISRTELEQFAEYVLQNKFFEMQRLYDCNNIACEKRRKMKPSPIPLRLMVSYGDRKKVITIAIWGEDHLKMRYTEYPQVLDYIIEAIRKMTHRLEG
jgi:hypothetical protein